MASTLLADNGASSGSAGIKQTADSTGVLALQTTTSGGTATTAMTIDNSQNVGLGVTPGTGASGTFQMKAGGDMSFLGNGNLSSNSYYNGTDYIYATTAAATGYRMAAGQHQWYYAASGTAGNPITFTQAMTLDASGNLGIGTTSPSYKLDVAKAGAGVTARIQNSSNSIGTYFYNDTTNAYIASESAINNGMLMNTSSGYVAFVTGTGSERARIDSSGNFLLNTTSVLGSAKFSLAYDNSTQNGATFKTTSATYAYNAFSFRNTSGAEVGYIYNTSTATTYSTSSDYRLKNSITPMTGALAKVALLKPCTYIWNSDGSAGEGFIAHELAEVVPQCVQGEKDGMQTEQYEISPAVPATFDEEGNELTPAVEAVMGEREVPKYQGIDTSFLVATLTAAIQEQQAIIQQLQADVAALKGQA